LHIILRKVAHFRILTSEVETSENKIVLIHM
jgi:hypothetical protein